MIWLLGFLPLAIWLLLLLGRDGFWRLDERDSKDLPPVPARWPSVVAVVPARNEADVIRHSLGSLLAQDYAGDFRVLLVDDQSEDGTGELARALRGVPLPREAHRGGDAVAGRPLAAFVPAKAPLELSLMTSPCASGEGKKTSLTVLSGVPRPPGWTGKLWAMKQGADQAGLVEKQSGPDFLWFTDADIAHAPDTLSSLVARAEWDGRVLVSLMARLSCKTPAEHFLIPAFVFFFDMLYPFAAVNDPGRTTAAAAGGCMLARATALKAAGGIDAIRNNIIDDCALGRAMKAQGPIWLGLTDRSVSLRPYDHLGDIRKMVARSAYAQLGYSPLQLAGTLLGLCLVYIAPVVVTLFADSYVQLAGALTWVIMALMFQPVLRFYRQPFWWGPLLPLIGAFYAAFTLDSAIQHWLGRGGMWKGRAQAAAGSRATP